MRTQLLSLISYYLVDPGFGTSIPFGEFIQQCNMFPAVLVNMINQEKKQSANCEENFSRIPSNTNSTSGLPNKKKPLTQKEAFEIFLQQNRNENEVTKCGNSLRLKMQAAKKSADKIQSSKENISKLYHINHTLMAYSVF